MLCVETLNTSIVEREILHALKRENAGLEAIEHPVFAFHVDEVKASGAQVATGAHVSIAGARLEVFYCPTELAIRHVLRRDDPSVVLTPLDVRELHDEVVERLYRGNIVRVDVMHQLSALFETTKTDPRLARWRTLPQWLIDESERELTPYPLPDGDTLDEKHAWNCLFGRLFDGESPRDDEFRALMTLMNARVLEHLVQLDDARKKELGEALVLFGHDDLSLALQVLWAMHDGDASNRIHPPLAALLVLDEFDTLTKTSTDDGIKKKIYARVGKFHLEEVFEQRPAEIAELADVIRTLFTHGAGLGAKEAVELRKALLDEVATAYQAMASEELSARSNLTEAGWRTSLRAALQTIRESKRGDSDGIRARLAESWGVLKANDYGAVHEPRRRAQMESMIRLANGVAEPAPSDPSTVVDDWVRSGSRVNQLIEELAHAALPPEVLEVYGQLKARWVKANEDVDKRVAERSADHLARGKTLPGAIPMEEFGRQVVRPLIDGEGDFGVLVIVLDGMSWSAFHQLQSSPGVQRRATYVPANGEALRSLQAPVPTVTRLARHALLTGQLDPNGTQTREREGFAEQFDGAPLFHKADLRSDRLGDVSKAIASKSDRVVGVVVNAIDDSLSHSSQMSAGFSLRDIPVLGELLRLADRANRFVVLTADHGHIVPMETTSAGSQGDGGERYRADDKPLEDGEVEVCSDLFVEAFGNRRLRVAYDLEKHYSHPSRGYHGGAHRAELLAPAVVLAPDEARVDTSRFQLMDRSFALPDWWNAHEGEDRSEDAANRPDGGSARKGELLRSSAGKATRKRPVETPQRSLFEPEQPTTARTDAAGDMRDSVFDIQTVSARLLQENKIAALDEPTQKALWALLRESDGRIPQQQFAMRLGTSPRAASRIRAAVERGLNRAMPNAAYLDEHGVLVINLEILSRTAKGS